jgi:hypothetical protein
MMKLVWARVRKWGKRSLSAGVFIYLLLLIVVNMEPHPACPLEEHRFQGQIFDIEICELGGLHDEKMRLRVYDKTGRMLAWRIATFANESSLNYMAIEDTQILYSDDPMNQEDSPADCVLNMPPNWVDWLEARLPGGIPGVNHCGVVSDEISAKARQSWHTREEAERRKRGEPPLWPVRPAAPALKEHP